MSKKELPINTEVPHKYQFLYITMYTKISKLLENEVSEDIQSK